MKWMRAKGRERWVPDLREIWHTIMSPRADPEVARLRLDLESARRLASETQRACRAAESVRDQLLVHMELDRESGNETLRQLRLALEELAARENPIGALVMENEQLKARVAKLEQADKQRVYRAGHTEIR